MNTTTPAPTPVEERPEPTIGGAVLAALRHRLGYSITELADELAVRPRTVRAWITGRDPIPSGVVLELAQLLADHERDVQAAVDAGEVVLPRPGTDVGWWTAVAAEAMSRSTSVAIVWEG